MGRNQKILIFVFLILAAAVGVVIIFWDALIMMFAPKLVLSSAIKQAVTQLEARWSQSPFSLLAAAYDPSGKNTSTVALSLEDDLLGRMRFDFELQADFSENRILAEGTIQGEAITFDASVYLDKTSAALSSQSLLQGGYYGITYDTFAEDLRAIPFSTFLIPKQTISGWEERVDVLAQWMNQSRSFPELPEPSQKDLKLLTLGILALKCDITQQERSIGGQQVRGYQYAYVASGTRIQPLAELLLGTQADQDASIRVDFYVVNRQLAQVSLFANSGSCQVSYTLELDQDILHGPLSFGLSRKDGETSSVVSMAVSPGQDEADGWETVSINDQAFSYAWDRDSGKLQLKSPEIENMTCFLARAEEGISVSTNDLSCIWKSLEGKHPDCQMVIKKGAEISAPGYKNLDEWSFQDLLTLFTGIGTVLEIF